MIERLILIILFVGSLVSTIGYYYFYEKNINKELYKNNHKKKKMVSPLNFMTKCVVVLIVTSSAILAFKYIESKKDPLAKEYYEGHYDSDHFVSKDLPMQLSHYSIEENEGYTKFVEEKDDVRYTYFICDGYYKTLYPTFIIYCEYIGDIKIKSFDFNYMYYSDNGIPIYGSSEQGCKLDDYLIIFGNTDVLINFEIEIKYYEVKYALNNNGSVESECDAISTFSVEIPRSK